MINWMKISVIIRFLFLFISCSENTTDSPLTIPKFTGKVEDANGNLLHDVDLYIIYHLIDIPSYQPKIIVDPDSVSLVYFTATEIGVDILLEWETSSEINNSGFEVQRKIENTEYEAIGFVSGSGTTTERHYYSFVDKNVFGGTNYYRLKQIDYDGTFNFSS